MKRRPNILWVCTDQQRQDTLGCYGNPLVHTPSLDRLAEQGIIFDNAYCQSPVCTPSRGAFLTGRYPTTSHTRQNGADIPETEVLVTKLFHDAGYYCGLSGKLHLSECNPQGGCKEMERRIDDGYDEFHWSHDTAPVWGLHNEYYKWLKTSFNCSYETKPLPDCPYVSTGMPEDKTQSFWCAEKAIDFIHRMKDCNTPWLFSVNTYDPHHPFDPPYSMLKPYMDELDSIPLPNYCEGELAHRSAWLQQDHEGAYGGTSGYPFADITERQHRIIKAAYWAMCDQIDRQVDRMLRALEETGQRDNTIVIFMSDHGELLGDHGAYLKGPYFYEGAVKVPLIISWPGGNCMNGRRKAFVELMDLPQTLLELCDIPSYVGMQGKSMVPVLKGETDSHKNNVFSEYINSMPWHKNPKADASMILTNDGWKLIIHHTLDTGEMYHLTADPLEQDNLFGNDKYIRKQLELTQHLLRRWTQEADPLPVRKAAW